MSMKLTQLTTHWNASDAYCVIIFLDELREVLMTVYCNDIREMLKQEGLHNQCDHTLDKDNF